MGTWLGLAALKVIQSLYILLWMEGAQMCFLFLAQLIVLKNCINWKGSMIIFTGWSQVTGEEQDPVLRAGKSCVSHHPVLIKGSASRDAPKSAPHQKKKKKGVSDIRGPYSSTLWSQIKIYTKRFRE